MVKLFAIALITVVPFGAWAQLYKCADSAGKTVYQDSPCTETPSEAKARTQDADARREASKAWEERMRRQREEIAKKPIPKEALNQLAWSEDFNLAITKVLAANRVAGCGQYRHRSLDGGRFAVQCTRDGTTWTEYLVDTSTNRVSSR